MSGRDLGAGVEVKVSDLEIAELARRIRGQGGVSPLFAESVLLLTQALLAAEQRGEERAREKALEEAAKAADSVSDKYRHAAWANRPDGDYDRLGQRQIEAAGVVGEVAAAILALLKPQGGR